MARAVRTVTPACSGGLAGGSTAGVATNDELRLQQRSTWHVGLDDGQPVGERRTLEVGEVVGPRCARRGSLVEDRECVAHAAASSAVRGT